MLFFQTCFIQTGDPTPGETAYAHTDQKEIVRLHIVNLGEVTVFSFSMSQVFLQILSYFRLEQVLIPQHIDPNYFQQSDYTKVAVCDTVCVCFYIFQWLLQGHRVLVGSLTLDRSTLTVSILTYDSIISGSRDCMGETLIRYRRSGLQLIQPYRKHRQKINVFRISPESFPRCCCCDFDQCLRFSPRSVQCFSRYI